MSSGDMSAREPPPLAVPVWMTSLEGASGATLSGRRLAVGRDPALDLAPLLRAGLVVVLDSLALAMIRFLLLAYASTSAPRLANLQRAFHRGSGRQNPPP